MMKEGSSAYAVLGGRTSSSTDVEELSYRCTSGSGRAMGRSTGCSSAEDVGQEGQTSSQVSMSYDDDQSDVQLWNITRAHSSLRGSVDLG